MASNVVNDIPEPNVEAKEYVESIMSSQRVIRVDTPLHSGRKRHHSDTDLVDSTVKKPRVIAKAKRALYDTDTRTDVSSGASTSAKGDRSSSVENLIANLSADMHMLFSALSERVDKLEKGLEQKIANKVAQILDKRINTEMNKLRKEVDGRCDEMKATIRNEIKSDIQEIEAKVESLANRQPTASNDITLNIVLRNVLQTENEIVENKVNKIFKDGLKVHDVTCRNAVRKQSRQENRAGVIIATMKSHDDKQKIMTKKASLKTSAQFSEVFIDHDKSIANRLLDGNFKAILNAVQGHGLMVKGGRVVRRDYRNNQSKAQGERDRDGTYADSVRRQNSNSGNNYRDNRANHNNNRGSASGNQRGWGEARGRNNAYNRGNSYANQNNRRY